jgi:methylated-DNA-protein-cysteine methyltransferase related protein
MQETAPEDGAVRGSAKVANAREQRKQEGRAASLWEAVYRLVQQIPRGRVMTYGQLAKALRLRGGARAAGHAMAACPNGRGIPWHRVVGAGGRILIREPLASLQRRLLESEGAPLAGLRVDLQQRAWNPPRQHRRKQAKHTVRAQDAV